MPHTHWQSTKVNQSMENLHKTRKNDLPLCSHFCGVTNNKHQDNPAEEGRHGVVPSVGAGDSIVKVGVPIEQNNGWV